jgi:hypothetical protein
MLITESENIVRIEKALEVIHEYWPDSSQIMWGESLDTLIQCAKDRITVANELKILRHVNRE